MAPVCPVGLWVGCHLPGRPRRLGGLGGRAGRGLPCCPSGPTDKDPARQHPQGAQWRPLPSPAGPPGLPGRKPHPPGNRGHQGLRGGLAGPEPPERQTDSVSAAPPPPRGLGRHGSWSPATWPSCWGKRWEGSWGAAGGRRGQACPRAPCVSRTWRGAPMPMSSLSWSVVGLGGCCFHHTSQAQGGVLPRPAGCWDFASSAQRSQGQDSSSLATTMSQLSQAQPIHASTTPPQPTQKRGPLGCGPVPTPTPDSSPPTHR